MAFKKGQSGNPSGRKPGVSNKITKELRDRIKDFLEGKWSQIEDDFDALESKDRVQLFEKLLQYVLPRMASMDIEGEIDLRTLSEETLDKIADRLINKKR
jgi:hypothetical protein